MVRGRGNRAFGISHSDLEVGTRLLKKIVGKILTAKGIRALVLDIDNTLPGARRRYIRGPL